MIIPDPDPDPDPQPCKNEFNNLRNWVSYNSSLLGFDALKIHLLEIAKYWQKLQFHLFLAGRHLNLSLFKLVCYQYAVFLSLLYQRNTVNLN